MITIKEVYSDIITNHPDWLGTDKAKVRVEGIVGIIVGVLYTKVYVRWEDGKSMQSDDYLEVEWIGSKPKTIIVYAYADINCNKVLTLEFARKEEEEPLRKRGRFKGWLPEDQYPPIEVPDND